VASTNPQNCGTNDRPTVSVDDVQWTPDNRQWRLDFTAGKPDSIVADLWPSLVEDKNKRKIFPIIFGTIATLDFQADSPDGLGFAKKSLLPSDILETTYTGSIDPHRVAIPDILTSITWAPDASEFSYSTAGPDDAKLGCTACVITMRRDYRSADDRKRKILVDDSKLPRVISTESLSWQW
jgi:hypothetical protein